MYPLHMGEFDLIKRYFTRPARRAVLGIGDDCALLQASPGMQLAISSDMLVQGRHFFADVDPQSLGHKALAVNLSDLAACGAKPLAFTLALALPTVDEPWLQGFSEGLLALAKVHDCELIGGDTTQGPLNICITVLGEIPSGQALLRSGAQAGDDIYVSGTLGDARLALDVLRGNLVLPASLLATARRRLEQPQPRIALGQALRGIASAAIDISDGLAGDLGHLLTASGKGAQLSSDSAIQLIASCQHCDWPAEIISSEKQLEYVLSGGDDYELAFTAPPALRSAVQAASVRSATPVSRIGHVKKEPGLQLVDALGHFLPASFFSFEHFS